MAREIVDERMADFEQRLVQRFEDPAQANAEAFKDPDFQYLLTRAQHAYARNGEAEMADTLVDIIAERSKISERNRLMMALNSAVETAAVLTPNEFSELSLCFLLRYTARKDVIGLNSFKQYFSNQITPLLPDLSREISSYQYLEATQCASIDVTSVDLRNVFVTNYGGVFCKGFTLDELKNHLPEGLKDVFDNNSLLIPCLHDSSKLQFDVSNSEVLEKKLSGTSLNQDQRQNLRGLFENRFWSEADFTEILTPQLSEFGTLLDLWKNTPLNNLKLTSLGIAIGHSNLRRVCGFDTDLSVWIK